MYMLKQWLCENRATINLTSFLVPSLISHMKSPQFLNPSVYNVPTAGSPLLPLNSTLMATQAFRAQCHNLTALPFPPDCINRLICSL